MNNKFLLLVKEMRAAQNEYFRLASIARRTKTPEAYDASKKALARSKALEDKVDKYFLAQETSPTTLA